MELRERNHFRNGAGGIMPQGSEIGLGTDSANPRHRGQPRRGVEGWLENTRGSRTLILIGLVIIVGIVALWISQLTIEDAYSPALEHTSGGLSDLGVIYIGSQTQDQEKKSSRPGAEAGLLVTEVKPEGPAERAGVQAGDLLVALNGTALKSSDSLVALLANYRPGDKIELVILRQTQRLKMEVTLAELK